MSIQHNKMIIKMNSTNLYIIAFLTLGLSFFQAQVDRSTPPKPLPERSVNFGEVTEMRFGNGMTVLVVENHKLPTVNANLYFNNGPLFEGNKAGYASMLGDMMRSGTENFTKEQLDEAIDYLGTDFYFGGSSAGFSSLKSKLDTSLDILTEVLFRPTFTNTKELEKLKKQQLTALESAAKNPDAISSNVEGVLLYGQNDPYGELITEESIQNIQISDFKQLYNERVIPNNAYLTFVGDITPKEVKKLLAKNFKKWKKNKNYSAKKYPISSNKSGNYIAFVDLPSASQSVISIINLNDYKKANSDYFAAKLGNSILGGGSSGRLFKNIREDKGWTYGAYSSLNDSYERMGKFKATAKVRNAVTDSAIVEFMKEIRLIGSQAPDMEELNTKKAEYNGNFVIGLENPSTVASFTRNIIIEGLPSDFYKNYLKNIKAVQGKQISEAMARYTDPNNLVILVVGKGSEVASKLETLGMPIKYFDRFGNEIEKPEFVMEVPAGMTVENVLNKAIEARGGLDKLSTVKSIESSYNGEVQGQQMKLTIKRMAPNFFTQKIEIPSMGMTAMQIKFNGKTGSIEQMGQKQEMPQEMIDGMKAMTSPIDELVLLQNKNKSTLEAIVPVNGNNAYQVDTMLGGNKQSSFFDVNSGLLLQTINYSKNPATGEEVGMPIFYSDYKDFQGVKVPGIIQEQVPGMLLEFTLENATINPKLSMEEFN